MNEQKAEVKRSEFVTVCAWVFIGLSSLTVAAASLLMIMVWVVYPEGAFKGLSAASHPLPSERLMAAGARVLGSGFFALALTALIGSIGLLKRRNWGRWITIVFLALGILQNLAGFGLQVYVQLPPADAAARQTDHTMLVVSAVFLVAFITLFGWLIKKLVSAEIDKEFTS